jgi:transposase-like protein
MAKKSATKSKKKEAVQLKVVPSTKDIVRPALLQTVLGLGLEQIYGIVEEERAQLCGPRYARDRERSATRSGTAPSELVLGGRRVSLRRPRVRTMDGQEVELESWRHFADEDPLNERAMEQMVVGVATRKYKRSLEPTGDEIKTRGTARSSVSRRFVSGTSKRLEELMSRDLSAVSFTVVMIDGLTMGDHVALVALGIDAEGRKHPLGVQEGATENAAACTALLTDLRDRGLPTDRSMLIVIDGSKALRKAVRDVFGNRAVVQRCQEHKIRNVTEHLPADMQTTVRRAMQDAYRCRNSARAKKLLENLQRSIRGTHPAAAASLAEGLEETLTVIGFGLPQGLERTLATTNPIENLNGTLRNVARNVKRWRDGSMVLRWVAIGLHEAAKGFRRLRGHKGMPRLVAALRDRDARLDEGVEAREIVA